MSGTAGTILIAALMLLMIYRRLRTLGTRQRLNRVRMIVRITVWTSIGVLVLLLPQVSPPLFVGGLVLGVALAVYAVRKAEIEHGENEIAYTPNSHVGTVLFALFAARMVWRLGERLVLGQPMWANRMADQDAATGTPITLVLLFVVIGYTVCYTSGLMIRSRVPRPA